MQPIDELVEFQKTERELFRSGQLRDEWATRYPQLFDADDLRLARGQIHYHFYEWFGAIYFFEKRGYLSLVEQYTFRNHERKSILVSKFMPPTLIEFMRKSRTQAPDLLVYAPDFSDWYFCEVKAPRDKVSARQEKYFADLETFSGKQIYLLRLQQKKQTT